MDLTTTLPPELLTLIANWLPSRTDAVRFALTCRVAHSSTKNQLPTSEPITAILKGEQTLYLKADQAKPWRGCWMTEYYGRTWYGEFSVMDVYNTDSGKTISLKMVIVSLRTEGYPYNSGYYGRTEETFRGDFQISLNDSSIDGQINCLFVPEYAKGWDRYYRGCVPGKYSFNPSPSEEMQKTLYTLDSVVKKEKNNEAKREEERERWEKIRAEQQQKEKEDTKQWRQRRKEEEERRQREIEERKRKEEARPKFSHEELKALVAAKDERILEALKETKILTHLREDAYPVAFGGRRKEEVECLPIWTLKSLLQRAGLF